MRKIWLPYLKKNSVQFVMFLFVNSLFLLKYLPRYSATPFLLSALYIAFIFVIFVLYSKYHIHGSEKLFRVLYWILLAIAVVAIIGMLKIVDPYTIRVDRWSALTFFWDSVFQGKYPYATHTHVSSTNFASPFPLWHLISLPFYFLGDVGIEIIFFLLLLAFTLKYYFSSYSKSFFFLILLLISPAYWWEVSVRSDSLSNALLVFIIILWFAKNNRNLSNSFILSIFICGAIASTRLSAILPLALFFFHPYLQLSLKQKIIFPLSVSIIVLICFSPFIFWDTDTWIFFSRNPFMSQTGNGNIYVLLLMIVLGVVLSLRWKTMMQFYGITSFFIFIFILSSQLIRIFNAGEGNLFSDAISDISYFNLVLPYCIVYLTTNLKLQSDEIFDEKELFVAANKIHDEISRK